VCVDEKVPLSDKEFQWALDGFTPAGLLNVHLLSPGQLTWSDVGGLHQVRDVLQQTLLWPAKVGIVALIILQYCF
jgi:SpoVK/Ycf46/Vps4 family AAA+-type ATPase